MKKEKQIFYLQYCDFISKSIFRELVEIKKLIEPFDGVPDYIYERQEEVEKILIKTCGDPKGVKAVGNNFFSAIAKFILLTEYLVSLHLDDGKGPKIAKHLTNCLSILANFIETVSLFEDLEKEV